MEQTRSKIRLVHNVRIYRFVLEDVLTKEMQKDYVYWFIFNTFRS